MAANTPARPDITFGIAHNRDFNGAYFTLQHLRMSQNMRGVEVLVIGDSPNNHDDDALQGLVRNIPGARYLATTGDTGTTYAREQIFQNATGRIVIVADCHILLVPGALDVLRRYYNDGRNAKNIVSGPMLYDNLSDVATHLNDQWREQMWGTWGLLWKCPCKKTTFTLYAHPKEGSCVYIKPEMGMPPAERCGVCGVNNPFPVGLPFAGHEPVLLGKGFHRWHEVTAPEDNHDIPGMGLFLFAMLKDNWVGMQPHTRRFGSEEMCLHWKVRNAGGRAVCLNGFRANHRFYRPGGTPYPITLHDKVRNYYLWMRDNNIPLGPLHAHYVGQNWFSASEWEKLEADPIGYDFGPPPSTPTAPAPEPQWVDIGLKPCPDDVRDKQLTDIVKWVFDHGARDFERHIPLVSGWAGQCKHVTEFSGRRETFAALMGCPGKIVSYNDEARDPLVRDLLAANARFDTPREIVIRRGAASLTTDIEETDMLLLDTAHNGERVMQELDRHAAKVRHYIVFHDTDIFGNTGDGGGMGMGKGITDWCDAHPEWRIVGHTNNQFGLTCLSRVPADFPECPINIYTLGYGPGTELKRLLESVGVEDNPKCDCKRKMEEMDKLGVCGCKRRRHGIIGDVLAGMDRWGWSGKITAAMAWKAVKTGLVLHIGVNTDPVVFVPKLVDYAIKCAEDKGFK